MLCNSFDKAVYCPSGLVDGVISDEDVIYGSWLNDPLGESTYLIKCWGRVHNYSVRAKVINKRYILGIFFPMKEQSNGSGI